jgi:CelD/BcsL family acetyltransferase involved in cellulose biosynthesis
MDYHCYETSLDELKNLHADTKQGLNWSSPFILPEWMQVWWQVFGVGTKSFIRVVKQSDKVIGVAPLMLKDEVAYFLGDIDVCDYQDFIVESGLEKDFLNILLDDLKKTGVKELDLKHVRHDSSAIKNLVPLAEERKYKISKEQENVSFEMDLPSSFEVYLESLSTKQRHEVRRKVRRLNEEGNITYRFIDKADELTRALETFFKMFTESRQDKAAFLTGQMQSYFKLLVEKLSEINLLKLGILELDSKPIAEIICFDYNECIYLYNSGYDPQYVSLSAGLLSKVYAIKDSIEKGKKRFDFLKGAEPYKGHLGGKEIPLYHCRISIV